MLCHETLFARRHPQKTPEFHKEMIRDWWSERQSIVDVAFRGAAKSTRAEEALCGMGLLKKFKYAIVLGNSYDRACERLTSIKHEIETSPPILELFGEQKGKIWNEGEIVLANDVKIQAFGAGQSMRGAKHYDARPDILFIDDLEDETNVATPEAREKLFRWLFASVLPACEPYARRRVAGTPLHPNAALERLRRDSGWETKIYPIVVPAVTDETKWIASNWPDRFPLKRIREIKADYERVGNLGAFVQEYLCQSEEQALKLFQEHHIVKAPQIPEWAPTFVIVDPARTVNIRTSARTGYVAYSWVGPRLYVRAAYGAFHKPDQIVKELFKLDQLYNPIAIGAEEDGLHEFLMQPIRQHILTTGQVLPIRAIRAPRDKRKPSFISGLHPFFEAKEILWCDEFPDLRSELLAFPTGRNDVLNALAYAPSFRAGKPVYEDFSLMHVAPELRPQLQQPAHLVINCQPNFTCAALVQFLNGGLRVFADWVREGSPTEALETIIPEATLVAGKKVKAFAPAPQFNAYNNFGLPAAVTKLRLEVVRGPEEPPGALTTFLRRQMHGTPGFLVSREARWTVNGLAAGYARSLDKSGVLKGLPDEGYYRTLLEGIESFAKWLTAQVEMTDGGAMNYAYTSSGKRFITSKPGLDHGNGASQLKRF